METKAFVIIIENDDSKKLFGVDVVNWGILQNSSDIENNRGIVNLFGVAQELDMQNIVDIMGKKC